MTKVHPRWYSHHLIHLNLLYRWSGYNDAWTEKAWRIADWDSVSHGTKVTLSLEASVRVLANIFYSLFEL